MASLWLPPARADAAGGGRRGAQRGEPRRGGEDRRAVRMHLHATGWCCTACRAPAAMYSLVPPWYRNAGPAAGGKET
ncbi:hypothetical protein ACU4GD_23525 [Cupriavidus basilensis]